MVVSTESLVDVAARPAVRKAGLVCLAAGLLGAASGLFVIVVEPSVADTEYSYPLTATAFVALQLWLVVQHCGLLAGQWGLWSSAAAGRSRLTSWGHVIAFAGLVLLTVTELVAVTAADDPYPSSTTDVLDMLYGVSTIAVGVGLLIVGLAVLRHGAWTGWRRWVPLAISVWVFIPLTPAIVAGFVPARLGIIGWMLLYAALGWALAYPRSAARTAT